MLGRKEYNADITIICKIMKNEKKTERKRVKLKKRKTREKKRQGKGGRKTSRKKCNGRGKMEKERIREVVEEEKDKQEEEGSGMEVKKINNKMNEKVQQEDRKERE